MKQVQVLSLLLSHFCLQSFAQNSVGLVYHSTHTGRNLAATYTKTLRKHSIYLGIKYHINRTPVDNQNHVFYKRFHATDFGEHMGFVLGYQFLFGYPNKRFNPILFVDLQYLNAKIRRFGFRFRLLPMGGIKGLQKVDEHIDTTKAWENSLGCGFRIRLSDRLALVEKFGLTFNVFTSLDKNFFRAKSKSEFGVLLSASLLHDL